MKASLILEDGASFEGISQGAGGERIGEVALNTAVVGYQEMMTDAANAGKILILTYPLIGNYGVAKKFYESDKCRLAGLVIGESSRIHSNWQSEGSFEDFLKNEDIVTAGRIDTRTLAVHIRDEGEMLAMVSTKDISISAAVKRIKAFKNSQSASMIRDISTNVTQNIEGLQSAPRIGVLDLGISASIIKQLKRLGCGIVLIPYDTSAEDILRLKINGMIISNGPENDAAMPDIVKTIKSVIGKLPMMGISTGHELIALATGAKLKKMKIGHRGVNYPVKRHGSDKGEITVQNHSYVVDDKSLKNKKLIRVTARNINDGSVEEMESASLKFISTQYYPASPGFDEVNPVFFRFLRMIPASARLKIPSGRSCEVKHAKA